MAMDFNAKREDLKRLWEDSFSLCRTLIDGVKEGKMNFNASLLKEVNAFIRLSNDFIDKLEEEERWNDEYSGSGEGEEDDPLAGCVLPDVSGYDEDLNI